MKKTILVIAGLTLCSFNFLAGNPHRLYELDPGIFGFLKNQEGEEFELSDMANDRLCYHYSAKDKSPFIKSSNDEWILIGYMKNGDAVKLGAPVADWAPGLGGPYQLCNEDPLIPMKCDPSLFDLSGFFLFFDLDSKELTITPDDLPATEVSFTIDPEPGEITEYTRYITITFDTDVVYSNPLASKLSEGNYELIATSNLIGNQKVLGLYPEQDYHWWVKGRQFNFKMHSKSLMTAAGEPIIFKESPYLDDEGNISVQWLLNFVDGIDSLTSESEETYYNMQGMTCNSPTGKGVWLRKTHEGIKKILISK